VIAESLLKTVPDFEAVVMVEKGLPLDSIDSLKEQGLTSTEISDLVIPARTLKHRRARGESLSREETERLVRVSRVLWFAERVFGNRDKSLRWLRKHDDRIGDRTHLSLLSGETGAGVITNMLGQIDEGMFS
jgi:putative toxin-antitoxin system antitoxin component (TIGR02293 family)